MIIFEILGVLLVVGLVAGFLKVLVAGLFTAGDKLVDKYNSSTKQDAPYWEKYLIGPYLTLIARLNHPQKVGLIVKMISVATVDGDPTQFETMYINSFKDAFRLQDRVIYKFGEESAKYLTEQQLEVMLNGILGSLALDQKEWFLRVLDRMITHGPRVPTRSEISVMLQLTEDIGIPFDRYKAL
jgi:hypothetical protein